MSKDTYNIGMTKPIDNKKNSYRENKSFFRNKTTKEKISEKRECLLNKEYKEKINIEKKLKISPDVNILMKSEKNKFNEMPKLNSFKNIYDITEITINESMLIISKKLCRDTVKVFSWNNIAGVYNDINSIKLQKDNKISVNLCGILLKEGYNHKISLGSSLQIYDSIFICDKNKREKILSEELEKLGIEKEVLSEIDSLKKDIKKIKNEKVYRRQIKEKFNQYFEKIEKNKKTINNKISETISNKFYFEKSINDDKKTFSESRIVIKNLNPLILSAINIRKNAIKEVLFKPENNNERYFKILSKEKMLRKQSIKENKPINDMAEEKEWDFIFDAELLIYSYLNRIIRHTKVMSYDLRMINSVYKLDIIENNQNKDEIIWQEKDFIKNNINKNPSENKVIDLPGYLKTLYLLEENSEKGKIKTNIKKSILENQEKTIKSKEEFVEKRNKKKIEIPAHDVKVTNLICQSHYEDKKLKAEETNKVTEVKKQVESKRKFINDRTMNNQFDEAQNYLSEVKEVSCRDKIDYTDEENYINESNNYYTKRYKYVF